MALFLALASPAVASPTSDVGDAEEALQEGDRAAALRLLRVAMAEPQRVKANTRALGFVLLGEALLDEADTQVVSGAPLQAIRDLRIEALAAGHQALSQTQEAGLVARGRAVTQRSRAELWTQAVKQVRSEHPARVKWWIDGLERLEGETLESLALRAMLLAHTGKRTQALTRFEAATRTADQEGTEIRTPRWGLTYVEQARALGSDEGSLDDAIVVLERGLAWHVRATTALGDEHDFDLRTVRRALEAERLALLMRIPERKTEALYAMDAVLKDNVGNVGLVIEYGSWLEQNFPNRAIDVYQDAQVTTPNDPRLPRLAGYLWERLAAETAQAVRRERDRDERAGLRLRHESQLRDARKQLERAHDLDPEDAEIVWHLVSICRGLGDTAAAAEWRSRAQQASQP